MPYDAVDVPLAAAVAPLVAPQLAAKNLAYTLAYTLDDCGAPPLVARVDPERVRQVLLNL